jgi:hypothetical protein
MKTVYYHYVLETIDRYGKRTEKTIGNKIPPSIIRNSTPQSRHDLLAILAGRLWGTEGKHWRIMQSDNLFGCFAQCIFMPQALYIK